MKKNLIFRLLLSCILLIVSGYSSSAQWISIPDTNFGAWLNANGSATCLQGNSQTGWQMDTNCIYLSLTSSIDCGYSNITDLTGISYFDSLRTLRCSDNQLSSLPALPSGLTRLECYGNMLTSLPALPSELTHLLCFSNQLGSLPALPSGLTFLQCGSNPLANLPLLPVALDTLDCSHEQISLLPALPTGLVYLDCTYNQLNNLPTLPATLAHLDCYSNQLTSLPPLPAGLSWFSCASNQLDSLPALSTGLTNFDCTGNQLSNLPLLPSGLKHLNCSVNQLSGLPALPISLISLGCAINQISSLPTLPTGLNTLNCQINQLQNLPALPASLVYLDCYDNQLTLLPALPDSLQDCYIYNNPLTCLPQLKRIINLNFSNTQITCVPNYGHVGYSIPPLHSLPLCNSHYSNGCEAFWSISGEVYLDSNSNCAADTAEPRLLNMPIRMWSNGVLLDQMQTSESGIYAFETDTGIYEVSLDTANSPFYATCPVNHVYYDTITVDSLHHIADFAVVCKPGFDLTVRSIAGRFRPGAIRELDIHAGSSSNFYGVNCTGALSGSIVTTINGPATYLSPASGALTPNAVNGNVITYNITDFGNSDFDRDFNIMVQTDTIAQIGDTVCISVVVMPITGDYNPTNNVQTACFEVRASIDPNEKQVYPAGALDINGEKWLTFTINFQNTGTDTALYIYITDTLDADLDISSFELLAYSKQPLLQIKGNAMRFNFININLPDSNTNEPASHGYVQYKVKVKDNLPLGTQIKNTAYIFFDFNVPVVTNTTTNSIGPVSAIQPLNLILGEPIIIYPNPANDMVFIQNDERMIGGTVAICDITGRELAAFPQVANRSSLVTSNFANGIYFITLTYGAQSFTRKLVLSH